MPLPRSSRAPDRGQDRATEAGSATRVPQRVDDVPQGGEDDGYADAGDDPAGDPPHGGQPASRLDPAERCRTVRGPSATPTNQRAHAVFTGPERANNGGRP